MTNDTDVRTITEIAREIRQDWPRVYFGALPYLQAMNFLETISDYYYHDSGREIVLRFLANASSYRGETARRVKKELRGLCR